MSCLFKIHDMIIGSKSLWYIGISHVVIGAMYSLCYKGEKRYIPSTIQIDTSAYLLVSSGLIESSECSSLLQ